MWFEAAWSIASKEREEKRMTLPESGFMIEFSFFRTIVQTVPLFILVLLLVGEFNYA